jgi:hypothetical protein
VTEASNPLLAALEPVRDALVARAHDDSHRMRTDAEAAGQQLLAEAGAAATAALADARAEGHAAATALAAIERARARRVARELVLQAQRAAYDELRRQARAAVRRLLADPVKRAQLVKVIQRQLGSHVVIREHPDGGFTARSPDGRSISATVGTLVETALADLDVEDLWSAG